MLYEAQIGLSENSWKEGSNFREGLDLGQHFFGFLNRTDAQTVVGRRQVLFLSCFYRKYAFDHNVQLRLSGHI